MNALVSGRRETNDKDHNLFLYLRIVISLAIASTTKICLTEVSYRVIGSGSRLARSNKLTRIEVVSFLALR